MATAESRARLRRAHLAGNADDPPFTGGGIARAPVAFAARTAAVGTGLVRAGFAAVGALADRVVTPRPSPYGTRPASIAIYSSDARDGG